MTISFEKFGDELKYASLRVEVLAILRRSFTDITGVAGIGLTTPLSKMSRGVAPMIFGSGTEGTLRMMMDGKAVSPVGAAMAGDFTIHGIDAHDGTKPSKDHAGSVIFQR